MNESRKNGSVLTIALSIVSLFSAITMGQANQNPYRLDASKPEKKIVNGHLKLGGENPKGDSISFTMGNVR